MSRARPSELAELLDVSRPNVSQHLAILQRDGLVKRRREDGRVLWEVVDPRLSEACALIDEILGHELALRAHALEPADHHVHVTSPGEPA